MVKKKKITITLSREVVANLRATAPARNISGFIEQILREKFGIQEHPEDNTSDAGLSDVIKHYREEKMEHYSGNYEKGLEWGKNAIMDKVISYEFIKELIDAKEEHDKIGRSNMMLQPWWGFYSDEKTDLIDNLRGEIEGDMDAFFDGYFDGVLQKWEEVESYL